jgi:predicted ATPase
MIAGRHRQTLRPDRGIMAALWIERWMHSSDATRNSIGWLGLLDDARSGRGRAALVLGDAGIGKTRLTEAFAAAAADTPMTIAWGRCTEAEAPPYWPWRQALRAIRGTASHALTAEESHGVRDTLFAAVAGELEAATAAAPALMVVEDIHWADASSLALVTGENEHQFRTKSYTDFGRSRTVVSADAEHPFRLMPNSPGS